MTDKFTDKEIIKALECLHKRVLQSKFAEEVTETEVMGLVGATDLINRQQEEIKRLERELDIALENDPSKTYPYEVITPYGVVFSKCEKGYEDFKMDIKSEAIKEYIEELKDLSYESDLYDRDERWVRAVTVDELDETYKEMVDDDK